MPCLLSARGKKRYAKTQPAQPKEVDEEKYASDEQEFPFLLSKEDCAGIRITLRKEEGGGIDDVSPSTVDGPGKKKTPDYNLFAKFNARCLSSSSSSSFFHDSIMSFVRWSSAGGGCVYWRRARTHR